MDKIGYGKLLSSINAVTLSPEDPYTWTSGIKSPIYCDNRLVISYPDARNQVIQGFVDMFQEYYPEGTIIAGTATAGIPHAAWLADRLNLPMVYVRSSAKVHGKGNQIEGTLPQGSKVVMVEDLISTGGSVIQAAEAVRKAGGDVLGVLAIMTYQLEEGYEQFRQANLEYHTLTDYSHLIEGANEDGSLDQYQDSLKAWAQDPMNWTGK